MSPVGPWSSTIDIRPPVAVCASLIVTRFAKNQRGPVRGSATPDRHASLRDRSDGCRRRCDALGWSHAGRGDDAACRFWSSWAQTADRYAQALGTEICDLLEGRTPSDEVATRFADATSAYLRELTELPAEAVKHFNEQIDKEPRNRAPRARRARAKE
jgi:hypothetical protein